VDLYVALADPAARSAAFGVTSEARRASLAAHQELAGRSLKGQLKQADRLRARYVAVVSADGATTLRDLAAGTEEELAAGDVVVRILRERGMG
jgi:histidyl-tRNA synthetase